jgi:hypothetical protein
MMMSSDWERFIPSIVALAKWTLSLPCRRKLDSPSSSNFSRTKPRSSDRPGIGGPKATATDRAIRLGGLKKYCSPSRYAFGVSRCLSKPALFRSRPGERLARTPDATAKGCRWNSIVLPEKRRQYLRFVCIRLLLRQPSWRGPSKLG